MNSKRGAVPFEVDGRDYVLRLTTNAQVRYEDASGETVQEALYAMATTALPEEDPSADAKTQLARQRGVRKRLLRLFCAGLTPAMDEDDVGDLIDVLGDEEAARLLNEAILLAFPQLAEKSQGNATAAKPRGKVKAATP